MNILDAIKESLQHIAAQRFSDPRLPSSAIRASISAADLASYIDEAARQAAQRIALMIDTAEIEGECPLCGQDVAPEAPVAPLRGDPVLCVLSACAQTRQCSRNGVACLAESSIGRPPQFSPGYAVRELVTAATAWGRADKAADAAALHMARLDKAWHASAPSLATDEERQAREDAIQRLASKCRDENIAHHALHEAAREIAKEG